MAQAAAPSQVSDPPIRDAATVLVVDRSGPDGPSVLMGQRGKGAAFMPSKYVFPGGAVDLADGAALLSGALGAQSRSRLAFEPLAESQATPDALAAAALRELAEETGLVVGQPGPSPMGWARYAASGIAPDPSGLIYFFRAITPPGRSRRFDARFLLMEADQIQGDRRDFSHSCDELSHLHWVPLHHARNLDLPFITEIVLAELTSFVAQSHQGPLPDPESVPFFDNRGPTPRFMRIV